MLVRQGFCTVVLHSKGVLVNHTKNLISTNENFPLYGYRVYVGIVRQLVLWGIHTNKLKMEVSGLGVIVLYLIRTITY